ncbi:MAG: hypothetical protein EOP84_36835, partial [Verrucomicrobiaceae bacterium]
MEFQENIAVSAEATDLAIMIPFAVDDPKRAASKISALQGRLLEFDWVSEGAWNYPPSGFRFSNSVPGHSINLRLGSADPVLNGGGVQIEIAVDRTNQTDLSWLGRKLRLLFEDEFDQLCRQAWVTTLTTAVEVSGASLEDVTPRYRPLRGQSVQFRMFDMWGNARAMEFGAVPKRFTAESLYEGPHGVFPKRLALIAEAGAPVEPMDCNIIWSTNGATSDLASSLQIVQSYKLKAMPQDVAKVDSRLHCFSFAYDLKSCPANINGFDAREFAEAAEVRGIDYALSNIGEDA